MQGSRVYLPFRTLTSTVDGGLYGILTPLVTMTTLTILITLTTTYPPRLHLPLIDKDGIIIWSTLVWMNQLFKY